MSPSIEAGAPPAAAPATRASGPAPAPGGAAASSEAYPVVPELLPLGELQSVRYRCRFARTFADLDAIQRLRYEVFNLELHEGLAASHLTERDRDVFDLQCHHLMAIHNDTGAVVGTYRLQVAEMAHVGEGFYSATEFDLSGLPPAQLSQSVELGRACIAKDHRNTRVLHLLWQGLLVYLRHNRRRYLFGCSSVTTQDPREGARVLERLRREGWMHPHLTVAPWPACACVDDATPREGWEHAHIPILFQTYLRHGARICGPPAIDRTFGTIDFFTWVDVAAVDTSGFDVDRRVGRGPAPASPLP